MSSSSTENRQQPQEVFQDFAEDKKCRICGFADTRNVNIFSKGNCKQLVAKILTVYPIVMYKNDPLPKNICRKCISNVSYMYNDILRVMKTQIKWINNVRAVQPRHNYVRVLDLIQNTNSVTRDSIKSTLCEEVGDLSVSRLLFTHKLDSASPPKVEKIMLKPPEEPSPIKHTLSSFSMDYDDGVSYKKPLTSSATTVSKEIDKFNSASSDIQDIQSLLEQNGCSLLQVGGQKAKLAKPTDICSTEVKTSGSSNVKIKEEIGDDNTLLCLDESPSKNDIVSTSIPGPPPLTVKCRLCPLQFNSLALLATHQIIHMRLCVPKILQKRYLHKRVRRGRLISVQNRKCIRCLNCWRVFVDNKSILEHWALGECDFYCHICGKEFAQAPKMLREHVPAAHGISYRSSKFHRVRLSSKITMSMTQTAVDDNPDYTLYKAVSEQEPLPCEELGARTELPKPKAKKPATSKTSSALKSLRAPPSHGAPSKIIRNEDGTVSCHICLKPFQNFKARNSHMRKHKPVYAYGDVVLPPLKGVVVNVKQEVNDYTDNYTTPDKYTVPDKYTPPDNYTTPDSYATPDDYTTPDNYTTANDYIAADNYIKPQSFNNASTSTSHATVIRQTYSATPSTSSGAAPLRGVRTKFVTPRSDLNGGGGSGGSGITILKLKPLNELQNPAVATANAVATASAVSAHAWLSAPTAAQPRPKTPPNVVETPINIKSEPMDMEINCPTSSAEQEMQLQHTTFTCIPCSDQFTSKLELFRHKRKCRAIYSFRCEYCSELFRCSADYYLHVAQIHSNSNTN